MIRSNLSALITAMGLAVPLPAAYAQTRSGGVYQISAESLNAGASTSSGGAAYSQTAALETTAGPQSGGTVYTVLSGFTAQLGSGPGSGAGGKAAFNAWQSVHFGSTTDPASAAFADPDGDGVANLLEFMFNLDPLTAGTPVVSAGAGAGGLPLIREEAIGTEHFLTIEYVRRKNSGIQAAQETSNLQSWSAAAFTPVGDPVPVSPVYERVKIRVEPALTPGAPRFVRLAVTVD